jgi:hypothetical protein
LDKEIADIQAAGLEISVEQNVTEFLGVKITEHQDGTFELTQPHLIEGILEDLNLEKENVVVKQTPAASTAPLCRSIN